MSDIEPDLLKTVKSKDENLEEAVKLKKEDLETTSSTKSQCEGIEEADDELDEVEGHIGLICAIALVTEDFAEKHLNLRLSYKEDDRISLRKAYIAFLKTPTEAQKSISSAIKAKIVNAIPEIDCYEDVIDHLLDVYFCYRGFLWTPNVQDILDSRDKKSLQSLIAEAPPEEDYDEELYSIFAQYL